jgi:hypothetical protein
MDYAPAFQIGHPAASNWPMPGATRAQGARSRVLHEFRFESVDTALSTGFTA